MLQVYDFCPFWTHSSADGRTLIASIEASQVAKTLASYTHYDAVTGAPVTTKTRCSGTNAVKLVPLSDTHGEAMPRRAS